MVWQWQLKATAESTRLTQGGLKKANVPGPQIGLLFIMLPVHLKEIGTDRGCAGSDV